MSRKEDILNAALTLFSARGYDGVGIKEIVDTAGITKPTLYHYFQSKNGLLEAILEHHFQSLFMQLSPAIVYEGDLTLTLKKIVGAYFSFAKACPDFYRLQLALCFAPPESEGAIAVRKWAEKQCQLLEMVFILAANNHGNMRERHSIHGATFLGTINTFVARALNGQFPLNDEAVHTLVRFFSHGIYS